MAPRCSQGGECALRRVTRLIKATKQQKHTSRDSIIGSSPSGSSLSITKPEVQVGQKMSTAQAELQACEAHLAAKEQELHAFRAHTIRSGLQARCKAMVGCGWAWGEMGKEGIRALETLDMNGHGMSYFCFTLPSPSQYCTYGCIGGLYTLQLDIFGSEMRSWMN